MRAAFLVVVAFTLELIAWLTWTNMTAPARLKAQLVRSGFNADDATRLMQLRTRGFDLNKPADIVFFLDIPAIYDARAAALALRRKGYAIEVVAVADNLGRSPSGSYKYYYGARYSLIARIRDAPTAANIRNARNLYSTLAGRYNGKYYGWFADPPADR